MKILCRRLLEENVFVDLFLVILRKEIIITGDGLESFMKKKIITNFRSFNFEVALFAVWENLCSFHHFIVTVLFIPIYFITLLFG